MNFLLLTVGAAYAVVGHLGRPLLGISERACQCLEWHY